MFTTLMGCANAGRGVMFGVRIIASHGVRTADCAVVIQSSYIGGQQQAIPGVVIR